MILINKLEGVIEGLWCGFLWCGSTYYIYACFVCWGLGMLGVEGDV